jgi:hypothetical protein
MLTTHARLDDGFTADDDQINSVHDVRHGAVEDDRARDAGRGENSVRAQAGISVCRHRNKN